MKTNAIIRIIIFSFVILLLVGVLLSGIGVGLFMFDPESSQAFTTGSVGEVSAQVRNLDIEWASGSVEIKTADVNTISFTEAVSGSQEPEMAYRVEGETLKIQYGKSGIDFNIFSLGSKQLSVTVPEDWFCSELKIEAASAEVTVSGLKAGITDLEIASGDSDFKNCQIESLEVETASGDVNYTGTLTALDCDAASADVTAILQNTPKRISMDSASGDLDLTLPADSGFTASMESFSGKLETEFETTYNGKYYQCGDGACDIQLDCASGNIRIRKAQ